MRHVHRHAQPLDPHPPVTRGLVIRWAAFYDPLVSLMTLGQRARLRRQTIALAQIPPGASVLEVGCGTGDVALAAAAQLGVAGSVLGIDPAPEMVALAQRKARRAAAQVSFQVGVIEALALLDRSVDVVLSSLMMHHLPHDLKRRGLAEIARVLRPGGRLLIVDIKRPRSWLERAINHVALHGGMGSGVQELPLLLQEAGFVGVESGDTGLALIGFVRSQTPR